MLISAFARTQIAALFGTAILTVLPAISFAGMLVPVSALSGIGQIMGRGFPMTYFLPISVGTFTKGLALAEITGNLAALAVFIPALSWRVGLRPASKSRSELGGMSTTQGVAAAILRDLEGTDA